MRISDWSSDVCSSDLAIFNTDLPRNQVDETTMNEMWGNAARSLFVENNGLALNTWKAANTRADRADRTQALRFAHIRQPRIFKRLARSTDAEEIGRASRRERVSQYV